ncbi:excinuclease ABC subunit UvrC [Actinospica sp. MGRD01-02]|uniref:UvrABC system protein C n=1 Tax=Actinospica acidithermotolerans TaxID=2828514 RepID=A0A941E2Z7_9ACTN|nr:excinuclease ABC subunit UvrC [Actinospica acidithermotolerans]MBR7825230.1 excinuclease ABC subunit UvrC [Actinospica acidithermotolerans]
MSDPTAYRPAPGTIPTQPGVYRFRDQYGRVVYVGKAVNLRSRLSNYFQPLTSLHPRTQSMVTTATSVEWTVVANEVEALALEYSWIKEFEPRFNVKYRDDKSYPSLAVTLNEEFPRVQVMRGPKRKGVRYFGPYAHAWAIRETVDALLRVFPMRSCSQGVFRGATLTGRPCLLGYIDKCSAPCVGRISPEDHRKVAEDFCTFMSGQTAGFIRRLEQEMKQAAAGLEFEKAARLRDDLGALQRAMERNAIVLGDGTDADVVGICEDELEAAVQVFHVRGGRVRGQRGWVVEKVEDIDTGGLVGQFLQQLYGDQEPDAVPREILVPALPEDAEAVQAWLAGLRGYGVELRVPQRGDKRTLMETVERNAKQALALHKTKRASDLTTRGQALEDIAEALGMDQAPLRIECYDISHTQGAEVVASMVVFEDALPRKSEYRRFTIKTVEGQDDVRSMHEVISRRFKRYLADAAKSGEALLPDAELEDNRPTSSALEAESPLEEDTLPEDAENGGETVDVGTDTDAGTGAGAGADTDTGNGNGKGTDTDTTFDTDTDVDADTTFDTGNEASSAAREDKPLSRSAYPPQLVLVDGGAPQVAAAARALAELGIEEVAVAGIAKRMEEIWLPGEQDPVILPRTSEALYLLQRVRDEAHRFAITFHRQRRSKAMTAGGLLDGIPGLGEVRRKALLKHFGSVKAVRAASAAELAAVPGIGAATAAALHEAIAERSRSSSRPAAVNTATGELLEDGGN